ncbi:MAG: tyrosine-type recombinase/integrase [bacterium]|nr:tyrosine-type recombinase/integrase [bacterium]
MRRPATLSATFVKTVRRPGRYGDGRGGHGLTLLVKPTRIEGRLSKTWSQRIRLNSRETNLGLGSYPAVTLAEARRRALENRQAIEEGRNPRAAKTPTFEQAANKVIELHSAKWRAGSRSRGIWESSLRTYVYPTIGSKRIDLITSADLMACLAPIWFTKAETARRVRQRISAVMKWAVAKGHRQDDPTATITAALGKNNVRRQHMRSVPHSQVSEALATIRATSAWGGTVCCFEFLTLCAVRSGEARLARWDEIDLDSATWTIPGRRTKTGEPHRVPLSTAALAVLNKAKELSDQSGLVFPSAAGQPISDSTISKLCRENSVKGTPHGMRSAFRSWAAEIGADWAVAELCLGHRAGSDVELAYQRSDLLERRRELMETWAQYLNP